MKTKLKLAGRILSIVLTSVLVLMLLSNIYVLIARKVSNELQPDVFGWSWAVVVSGSMEEKISVDDLIIVHRQKDYDERDIISFESGKSVVTHRIVEKGDGCFITKGDANNTPDSLPVPKEKVIGKVVLIVPGVGKITRFFQEPLGISLLVFTGLLIIELPFLIQKFEEGKGKADENTDKKEEE